MVQSFQVFLDSLTQKYTPVIDASFQQEDFVALDLSDSNDELDISILKDPMAHHLSIQEFLKIHKGKVAFGGYLEQRALYDRSDYFQAEKIEDKRNIHLGIDLWCEAGTHLLAPLDGILHSFQNNTNFGDYGPTIILEHSIQEMSFYTLYGHLSLSSLASLEIGQKFKKGEVMATLGTYEENGTYAPHLHFQIIKDLEGNVGDYPGVCSKSKLAHYKNNCPDPNLLLKIY